MGKKEGGEGREGQEVQRERKEQTMRAALGDLRIVSLMAKGPEEEMERKADGKR